MDLGFNARIPICMRCGSREVRHQTSGDGLWAAGGEGVAWVCDTCHHIGSPFLMDRTTERSDADAVWQAEYADAAFDIEDDAWHGRSSSAGRSRALGGLFATVGALFLIPVVSALQTAAATGSAYAVVRAIVGTGWLLAIGVAMLLVGLRRFRPIGTPLVRSTGDKSSPETPAEPVGTPETEETRV